jgi:hypothetical protein
VEQFVVVLDTVGGDYGIDSLADRDAQTTQWKFLAA